MATDLEMGRPNIRIEINNTSTEPMEVDENDRSEEEGEIRDNFQNLKSLNNIQSGNENLMKPEDIFRRGIDILNIVDKKKLQERAKRFALKPEEISTFTEENLQYLYRSLGLTSTNVNQVRFEAIHVRSSKEVTIRSIIPYFMEYAPNTIEIVDEESYNVVWEDKLSTARALFNMSQVVRGMPVRVASEHVIDNFILDDSENVAEGNLSNENRQIELREDNVEEPDKLTAENSVDISIINIPIPPGYWRLGKKPINSFSVLMRFSLKIDMKPYQIEKCSRYYKNNSTTRNNSQYKGIFSRNKEIIKEVHDKDPWGSLAKNWDEDLIFREREHYTHVEVTENMTNSVTDKPEMRVRLAAKRRLGIKQDHEKSITISTSEKDQSEESDRESERKSSKMPRMRMYADEEEEKIKRKKLLLTLKKQTEKLKKTEIPNSDLRNILQITNKKPKANIQHNDDVDLSVNLKNRGRKLVFTVSQEGSRSRTEKRLIKDRLDKPRVASPEDKKPISPIRFKRNKSPEQDKKWPTREPHRDQKRLRSPVRRRESRRSSERRFGGRMYSSKMNENYYIQKPKSKVALVIKTQKKPSVASAIQSRNRKFDTSSSSSSEEDSSSEESSSESSEEGSEGSSSSSSDDSASDTSAERKHRSQTKLSKVPLKVEIRNDQYRRK